MLSSEERTVHERLAADTLLNVFLAIAVDNLATADALTAAEEAQARAVQQALLEEEVSIGLREEKCDRCETSINRGRGLIDRSSGGWREK